MNDKSEFMGKDPVWPLLLRFCGPSIIAAVVTATYNLVDAIFAGALGLEALAALAAAFPLMIIYTSIGFCIGFGSSSLISRSLGARKQEEANVAAGNAISVFLIAGAVATLVFYPSLKPLLSLFGASGEVLEQAISYMSIETGFIALNFLLLVLAEMVRAGGDPSIASGAAILSTVINCIMDPVLAFGLGPFPRMGIAGLALATTVGRAVSSVILLVYLTSRSVYSIRLRHLLPRPWAMKEILGVGMSSTVRMAGGSVAQVLSVKVASSFGVIPLALLAVLFRINSLVFHPSFGLGQGIIPLVGYNYGAKLNHRVREIVTKATTVVLAYGVVFWLAVTVFAAPILSVFGDGADYLGQGIWALRIFAFDSLTIGAQMVLSCFFQGLGKWAPALIVSSSRQLIFLIPCVLILPQLFGLTGLWLAFPVASALALALSLAWAIAEFRSWENPSSASQTRNKY
ncbi:MAG: MATE family efflux transporter [Candidatus Hadarchaeales archaeon]